MLFLSLTTTTKHLPINVYLAAYTSQYHLSSLQCMYLGSDTLIDHLELINYFVFKKNKMIFQYCSTGVLKGYICCFLKACQELFAIFSTKNSKQLTAAAYFSLSQSPGKQKEQERAAEALSDPVWHTKTTKCNISVSNYHLTQHKNDFHCFHTCT